MLKRKRESEENPLFEDSYLHWLPFELIEEIVPFLIKSIWKCAGSEKDVKCFIHESFNYIINLDISKTLFYEFRKQYINIINECIISINRCIQNFISKNPPLTCLLCRNSPCFDFLEGSAQYYFIYQYPELRFGNIHIFNVRSEPIFMPSCQECFVDSSKTFHDLTDDDEENFKFRYVRSFSLIWTQMPRKFYFIIKTRNLEDEDDVSFNFTFQISRDKIFSITFKNQHEDEYFDNLLESKIRKNQFLGLIPYIRFKIYRDYCE